MLKPEGIMVYATCSILPSENQKQVELFLQSHPNFVLIEDKKILASDGFDGFYMAKLKRLN
jgi:16S rRNA (cytosine967-C5)-methyltransferase